MAVNQQCWLRSCWDHASTDKLFRRYLNLKMQSTISVCVCMLLFTVLFFVFSTLDPGKVAEQPWLSPRDARKGHRWKMLRNGRLNQAYSLTQASTLEWEGLRAGLALQGMGVVFRRGSRGMHELVVAHLGEETSPGELRIFLRTLHRSGIPARSDVVLLFPWSPLPLEVVRVIREEEKSFRHMVMQANSNHLGLKHTGNDESAWIKKSQLVEEDVTSDAATGRTGGSIMDKGVGQIPVGSTTADPLLVSNASFSVFNFLAYRKSAEESMGPEEPALWGNSSFASKRDDAPRWASWGSIVGFEMQELDPTEMLKGFIDRPDSQLRRWVCYQMILGMVRPKFRHVALAEVGGVTILGDALVNVRKREGLYLAMEDRTWNDAPAVKDDVSKQEFIDITNIAEQEAGLTESEEKLEDADAKHGTGSEEDSGEAVERTILKLGKGPANRRRKGTKRKRKQVGTPGLIEDVYGKQLWKSLEEEEKEKGVVSSGMVMGGIKPIRTLSNAMVTEIVRVAIQRKNRHRFHDKALINYLVHKSSVLGRRVLDHMRMISNSEAVIHVLPGSRQQHFFTRAQGNLYLAIVHEKQRSLILKHLHQDICESPADATAYSDCISKSKNAI